MDSEINKAYKRIQKLERLRDYFINYEHNRGHLPFDIGFHVGVPREEEKARGAVVQCYFKLTSSHTDDRLEDGSFKSEVIKEQLLDVDTVKLLCYYVTKRLAYPLQDVINSDMDRMKKNIEALRQTFALYGIDISLHEEKPKQIPKRSWRNLWRNNNSNQLEKEVL